MRQTEKKTGETHVGTASWNDILTLIALVLNLIALAFVAYQIYQTKTSIDLAKRSLDQQQRLLQMNLLPEARFLFIVGNDLRGWLAEIDKANTALQMAVQSRNRKLLEDSANEARKTKMDLVQKSEYEDAPEWLSALWLAGAKHYYGFQYTLRGIWTVEQETTFWQAASGFIVDGRNCSYYLRELLSYIDQAVPKAYANTPEPYLDDNKFLADY